MASGSSDGNQATRKNVRSFTWSEEATLELIQIWGEETIQLSLDAAKTSKESTQVYKTVLVQLQYKGHCEGLAVKDIVNKMKKLRQKYKGERDKKRRSGTNRAKDWKFFKTMDQFMSKKHNVDPPLVIDTMADHEREDESSVPTTSGAFNTSAEEELMTKYGEGHMHIAKCGTCNYEQVIHSAGVHESGGSIKVYAEADEFSCPNCEKEFGSDEVKEIVDKEARDIGNAENANLPQKAESKTTAATKKKRKSNVEKSLEVVFQKFQDASETDFLRLQKMEETRVKQEHEFHLQQTILENERRREEREHELQMFSMMMGYQPQVYSAHHQQQPGPLPLRSTDNYPASSSFSGYGSASGNQSATIDQPDSYFEL